MTQAVHDTVVKPAVKRSAASTQCGTRPGNLRIKVERRHRGKLEQATLRVRAIVSKVTSR
jgi:hypothetical protein